MEEEELEEEELQRARRRRRISSNADLMLRWHSSTDRPRDLDATAELYCTYKPPCPRDRRRMPRFTPPELCYLSCAQYGRGAGRRL